MKKGLKIGLIVGGSLLVAGGARAGLTKAGIIPNWFDIEILCPGTSIDLSGSGSYDRTDPDCSKKCYQACEKRKDEPLGYTCGNGCISKCEKPTRKNCLNSCEMPDMGEDLQSYYTSEDYESWYKRTYTTDTYYFDGFGMDNSLSHKAHYNEWIDEMFDGYQDELKTYESCIISCGPNPDLFMVMKPIIYLYPTEETQVNVTLGAPENLSHTYPKYNPNNGRNVVAQPNGDLEDIDTGRKLYALYREGKTYAEDNFTEGFVVKGEDTISFLEEKLSTLGLNERETEEFIVYWLPQMENNKYNLIRFETKAEQDENMLLNITPTPDTVIRVMMDRKVVEEPIDIPEQELVTPKRNGFTVVEWGGSPRN